MNTERKLEVDRNQGNLTNNENLHHQQHALQNTILFNEESSDSLRG